MLNLILLFKKMIKKISPLIPAKIKRLQTLKNNKALSPNILIQRLYVNRLNILKARKQETILIHVKEP
jgi:hypothetical protein